MAKGKKTGGGSRKGSPNKVTTEVREAIQQAFTDLGGAKYLVQVGTDNPSAFCKLLGMTLPKDVKLDVGETLEQLLLRAMK
jgi:hypothetical protein